MSRQIPPLNPLRAFEVAARHLSFTRAAEELFVTPSAVSHQVKTLEENLGVQLFIREAKALVLTPAGTAYLPSVQLAFRQLAEATQRLQSKDRPSLKINMPPTFAVKWLIPRMDSFMRAHPDIDLKVSTSNHRIDFERDDFDMAIRYGRGDYPGLHAELCLPVEVVLGPLVREADGLAMSSRNRYLDVEQRREATYLSQALFAARDAADRGALAALNTARATLRNAHGVDLDYLELTGPDLGPVPDSGPARMLIAARVGPTRLIDNIALELGAS